MFVGDMFIVRYSSMGECTRAKSFFDSQIKHLGLSTFDGAMERIADAKETAGRSTPARPGLKLRKTRISRIRQLRRAIRLWFLCVFLGRQGPPRPANRRISENKNVFLFSTTHTRIYARAARRVKSRNEAQANHNHT